MSAKFLRENLALSFLMATCLVAGVLFHQRFHEAAPQLIEPSDNQNIDLRGQPAPEILLPTLEGESFALSQWRGHVVLVNFWATWCPPCLKEIPLLIDFQERGRGHGIRVVGVAIDELPALRQFAEAFDFNFPIVWTTFRLMEQFGNGVGTMPYSVLVDAQGHITEQHFRPLDSADLDRILSSHQGTAQAAEEYFAPTPPTPDPQP